MRLRGFDYASAGTYFVTMPTLERGNHFGRVIDGDMRLNKAGGMVADTWMGLPRRFPGIVLDAFVVMPDHLHGIVIIGGRAPCADARRGWNDLQTGGGTEATPGSPSPNERAPALGDIIGAFKSITTLEYARGVRTSGWDPFPGRLWQRGYHDSIVRTAASHERIRHYILDNPRKWRRSG